MGMSNPKGRIRDENDRTAAILVVRLNDGRCEFPDCGGLVRVTAHHGIHKSQCAYHRFSPMNLHCICEDEHAIAHRQESLYFAKLREYNPALLDFILDERLKQNRGVLNFRHTLANQKIIRDWLKWAGYVETLGEFRELPTWQEWSSELQERFS